MHPTSKADGRSMSMRNSSKVSDFWQLMNHIKDIISFISDPNFPFSNVPLRQGMEESGGAHWHKVRGLDSQSCAEVFQPNGWRSQCRRGRLHQTEGTRYHGQTQVTNSRCSSPYHASYPGGDCARPRSGSGRSEQARPQEVLPWRGPRGGRVRSHD